LWRITTGHPPTTTRTARFPIMAAKTFSGVVGLQLPVSALVLAVLVGMVLQDFSFDNGTKTKSRVAYYAVTHGASFPQNDVASQYLGRDLDILEGGAVVTAATAVLFGLFNLNFDEMTLAIMLGALFYLRHDKVVGNLDKIVANTKTAGSDVTNDIRDWDLFFVFGMVSTLYIHVKNLGLQTAKGSSSGFRLSLTPIAAAVFLGMVGQGLIFDHLCTKGWVYQARYYKDLVAAPAPGKKADVMVVVGTYVSKHLMEGVIALAGLGCVIDVVAYGTYLRSLISGAGVAAGGYVWLNMVKPNYQQLKVIADTHKGKGSATLKETHTKELLETIKELNLQVVMAIAAFLLLQLVFARFSFAHKEEPADEKEDEKKDN